MIWYFHILKYAISQSDLVDNKKEEGCIKSPLNTTNKAILIIF